MFLLLIVAVRSHKHSSGGNNWTVVIEEKYLWRLYGDMKASKNVARNVSTSSMPKERKSNQWNVCGFAECNTFTVSHYHDNLNIVGGTSSILPLIWSTFQIRPIVFAIPIDNPDSLEHVTQLCSFSTGFSILFFRVLSVNLTKWGKKTLTMHRTRLHYRSIWQQCTAKIPLNNFLFPKKTSTWIVGGMSLCFCFREFRYSEFNAWESFQDRAFYMFALGLIYHSGV